MKDVRDTLQSVGSDLEFSLIMKRNCSMSPQALAGLLIVTACLSFAIGIGFALFGAWPVLPFVGLEVVALAAAFYVNGRHATDYERIAMQDGALLVEIRDADRIEARRLNPRWVSLVAGWPMRDLRLALRSEGQDIEIGRHLDESGRAALARELAWRLERVH